MEETWFKGNLASAPFPQILFRIHQAKKSGYLKIKIDQAEKSLYFERGNIALIQNTFSETEFLQSLAEKKLLEPTDCEKCESFAAQEKISLTKAILELDLLSPAKLWQHMETFFKKKVFTLFDLAQAEYSFNSDLIVEKNKTLLTLGTLDFILQGIRKMQNYELIQNHIPAENWVIQVLSPDYMNKIDLAPYEKYVLNMKENKKTLKNIYETSELGRKESQKVIYTLLNLGLIGFPQQSTKENISAETSPVKFEKILDIFNNRCSYIFKYISKEIGPVALNVLDKSLEEAKTHLSHSLQKTGIGPDGKIDMSFLKTNKDFSNEEIRKSLVRDMNEILAAEILAVKKTLGNEHEAALIKSLDKIGDSN